MISLASKSVKRTKRNCLLPDNFSGEKCRLLAFEIFILLDFWFLIQGASFAAKQTDTTQTLDGIVSCQSSGGFFVIIFVLRIQSNYISWDRKTNKSPFYQLAETRILLVSFSPSLLFANFLIQKAEHLFSVVRLPFEWTICADRENNPNNEIRQRKRAEEKEKCWPAEERLSKQLSLSHKSIFVLFEKGRKQKTTIDGK